MDDGTTGPIHFINLEYFFRLLYEARNGIPGASGISLWAAHLWSIVSTISFLMTLIAVAILVYSTARMRQIKHDEHHLYDTIQNGELEVQVDHARWGHVMSLIESAQANDWRQAIIEADIMLDDLLVQLGYKGDTVGDKLKAVDPSRFKTLEDAWTAHKVRNELAHQGSAFPLSNHLAYRTIKQYEAVFREFNEI